MDWIKANGGPVTIAGIFLSQGGTLVFQHGLIVRAIGWISFLLAALVLALSSKRIQRLIPPKLRKLIRGEELTTEFWEKAFKALPFPAFIKEFPNDQHIRDNDALARFQGKKPGEAPAESDLAKKPGEAPAESDLAKLIQQDHKDGDKLAWREDRSVQLELTDKVTTLEPRPILTLKTCIEYENEKYIVGCYVPVILPRVLPSGTSFKAAECGGQVLFSCPSTAAKGSNNVINVQMGESLPSKGI